MLKCIEMPSTNKYSLSNIIELNFFGYITKIGNTYMMTGYKNEVTVL
ncbi:hypothetical protein AGMMS49546_38790 [Spirochaetia bacterium]|nr:hypothetical protein AGMMS49546_38790 [Spirochaetia bacterium]